MCVGKLSKCCTLRYTSIILYSRRVALNLCCKWIHRNIKLAIDRVTCCACGESAYYNPQNFNALIVCAYLNDNPPGSVCIVLSSFQPTGNLCKMSEIKWLSLCSKLTNSSWTPTVGNVYPLQEVGL